MFPDEIEALARAVVTRARDAGWMIATAESCTGGLVAGAITQVAGSSAMLDRGFVTYSNAAKTSLLDVPDEILETYGAVSRQTAEAMAAGALTRAGVDLAVAITGVAGPGGGSPEKPVGLVHFATATREGVLWREARFGELGREAVRTAAVRQALEMLLARLAA